MSAHPTLRWFAWRTLCAFTIALIVGVLAIAYHDALEGHFLGYLQPQHTVTQQHAPSANVLTLR